MNKEIIKELVSMGHDLNAVQPFVEEIRKLDECGVSATWIRDIGKFQIFYRPFPTRLYVDSDEFSCERVILEIVKYNMASCLT